ncbi:MAG: 2-hydroxyacid dehydrogenase [Rhodoferax sp.]|nr:2-hydroxyacid dehydrogenase [Rhodoferax sp.]
MTQLLNNGRLPPFLMARLTAEYRLHDLMQETDPKAFLAAHGYEFTGLVTSAPRGADAALIKALPNLQVISSFGVGLEKIDLAAAASQGVAVGYTPDVLNDCVADTAFGLVLDVMRGFSAADRFVRSGAWAAGQAYPLARKVSGQRLGLVGFGRIGQTIARRAAGFDMAVRYHSRRPVAGVPWLHEPSLLELAAWCDCLLVIVAGGAGTRHLINAPVLDALGPRGFLVNVSRGSVIDEPALVQALVNKRIAGAGLDVFENEPQVPADLLALDNVVLLPHIASATQETREAMAERVMANLASFFSTGQVMSAATP